MNFIRDIFRASDNSLNPITVWSDLTMLNQVDHIVDESYRRSVVIFKHSVRCSISSMAKNRVERDWNSQTMDSKLYYLDLLSYREVSNEIAKRFDVEHQSPQVIVIKNGKAVYDASHNSISVLAMVDYI